MTAPLTFYTHPMSRGRVARWMLEETGLSYDTVLLEYGTTMKAPEYLAINPMGKVPALKHGDTVITEQAAICMYLADLVPEKQLAPPVGSFERGSYYRWISFMAPLEQLMVAKASGAAHAQSFEVVCRIAHHQIETRGHGPTRRAAEQQAAEIALTQLEAAQQDKTQ